MFEIVIYNRFTEMDSYYVGTMRDAEKFVAINGKHFKSAGATSWMICDCDMCAVAEGSF